MSQHDTRTLDGLVPTLGGEAESYSLGFAAGELVGAARERELCVAGLKRYASTLEGIPCKNLRAVLSDVADTIAAGTHVPGS